MNTPVPTATNVHHLRAITASRDFEFGSSPMTTPRGVEV
jgi:hypothetical protein